MFNKKILAAAVVSALSFNAFAAQDLTDDDAVAVKYADETIADAATVVVDNANAVDLDVVTTYGFSIADGTSKYVRIELTNATFSTAVTAAELSSSNVNAGFAISQGGQDGDDYVIIEVSAVGGDIQQTDTITLAAVDYEISQTAASSVAYSLHDNAPDAVSGNNSLSDQTGPLAVVGAASTGTFTVEAVLTGTVASSFRLFDATAANAIDADTGYVGEIDVTEYPDPDGAFNADGTAVVAADLLTDAQDVTLMGDFSWGQWNLQDDATCAGGGAVDEDITAGLNADEDEATVSIASLAAGPYYLCVDVAGANLAADEIILKGTYSVELVTDAISNDIGEVQYDTTTVEVPYLTTFGSYNQRFYMVNQGTRDADYTFSFTSEDGVTATAGAAATGTIPAGEMIAVRSVNIVTLAGGTRTAATIEIEAEGDDVIVSTQTVNLSNGGTDTTVLYSTTDALAEGI